MAAKQLRMPTPLGIFTELGAEAKFAEKATVSGRGKQRNFKVVLQNLKEK